MAAQSAFGAGYLWGTLNTPAGATTPRLFAALQNVSVEFTRDLKPLHGNQAYALEQGSGKAKVDCKAEIARFDPNVYNDLFFGGTIGASQVAAAALENQTVPASPFKITVTNAASWQTDLGVYDTSYGKFDTKVTGAPATIGQYQVSAGIYTFFSSDVSHGVQISYTYKAATGYSLTSGNPVIGATAQVFRADLFNSYKGQPYGITLFACQTSKFGLPFKQDDWMMTSFEFSAQDDGAGNVVGLYGVGQF